MLGTSTQNITFLNHSMCMTLNNSESLNGPNYTAAYRQIIDNSNVSSVIKSDYLDLRPIEFCEFAQWSWTESIPLVDGLEDTTRDVCN